MQYSNLKQNKPFGFERPEDSPGFLLWQVSLTWQRRIKEALEPHNIAHSEFVTMAMLAWFENIDHKPTQADIVSLSRLDKMTLSKALKQLASDGYVTRTDMEEDTRTKSATLTKKGKELIGRLIPIIEKIDEDFFGSLDDNETAKLLSIFRKL
jgi:DNA-binding MarR family transcriptional regulator